MTLTITSTSESESYERAKALLELAMTDLYRAKHKIEAAGCLNASLFGSESIDDKLHEVSYDIQRIEEALSVYASKVEGGDGQQRLTGRQLV